jgi:UDP-N-acetylglucosamine 2-epimerase (non-hydrolysing)
MIGLFYGTRPEYIKLLPVARALNDKNIEYELVQIQQHTDLIRNCEYDRRIRVFTSPVGNVICRLNDIFHAALGINLKCYKYVMVQGDTSTAAAVALSAFNQGVPVMHVEAGLRTYDKNNPYPEETNRRIISALASVHYCPTDFDVSNLLDEGFRDDEIVLTGNTVIDNLRGREATKGNTIIVTMHRRENQPHLREWFSQIEALACEHPDYEFIFPMHPSPQVQKHRDIFNQVQVIDPVDHETMLDMIASCHCVITDSGGMQEECSFFRKRCFVCRAVTERPCAGQVLCKTPGVLHKKFNSDVKIEFDRPTPFGDGYAGEKIAEDIQRRV